MSNRNITMALGFEFRDHGRAVIGDEPLFILRELRWESYGLHFGFEIEPGHIGDTGIERETALMLLARTYRSRSRRVVGGEVMPVPTDWWELLHADPIYAGSGLAIAEGWFDLMVALAEARREIGGDFYPYAQTKEKFGGLRAYGLMSGEALAVTDAAEHLSFYICETCGRQGRERKRSWIATRCDEHAET